MANIGLSKPYYAIYSNTGSTVSYADGGLLGKAVELSMELEGADANILYADNGPAESASQFAGGTLTITTDDLLPEPTAAILGLTLQEIDNDEITTPTPKELVFGDAQVIPYVGFGVIVKKQQSNVTKWMGIVYPKVQFSNPGIEVTTQGETIEWQTPEPSATIMRDDTTAHNWCRHALLDSEADAEAYVKGLLGIENPNPALGTLTVSSAAGSTAGQTAITVQPTITQGNHYVYQTGASVTLPTEYGADVSSGWTAWNGTGEISATTGNEIGIVEADSGNKAVKAGKTTVTANGG